MKLKSVLPVCLLCSVTLSLAVRTSAAPGGYADLFDDPVLAKGTNVQIKRSQLDEAYVAFKANRAARNERITERERPLQEAQLLDRLIVTQLMLNRATEGDRLAANGMAEKFMADAKKVAVSEEAFNLQLKATGLTPEAFNRRVMEQAISEAVLDREVKSKITVSDEHVKDFYDTGTDLIVRISESDVAKMASDPKLKPEDITAARQRIEEIKKANLDRLVQPERVKVAHVLLVTRNRETEQTLPEDVLRQKRQQIEKLRERALKGDDFLQLVKEFSEDRGVKETGGIYTFSQADPFAPEFKAAAFTLQTNQVSDVVQTVFGYHIIKQLERMPSKKIAFDDVKKDLRDFLIQQEYQHQMPDYFSRLKKEALVEVVDPKYRIDEVIKAATPNR